MICLSKVVLVDGRILELDSWDDYGCPSISACLGDKPLGSFDSIELNTARKTITLQRMDPIEFNYLTLIFEPQILRIE